MEVIVAAEHVEMVRRMLPAWVLKVSTHEIALPVILVGLVLLLLRETKHGGSSRQPADAKPESQPIAQAQSAAGSASVEDSGKAILKDVGNPRINIYTHPPAPKPQPPKQPPEPKSNISLKSVRPAWIRYDDQERCFIEVEDARYGTRGLIARFKNESAAHGAADANYIRAELVLRDVNHQEMEQGVHAACWLRETTDTVDFIVGEDHWLLLGAVDPKTKTQWAVPWMEQKRTWEGPYYHLAGHMVSGVSSIEIHLIGESNRWLIKPVIVDIVVNDGEPAMTVRPPAQQ
jgi:hypothetical protein